MSKVTRRPTPQPKTPSAPKPVGNAGGNKQGPPSTRPFGKGEVDYQR